MFHNLNSFIRPTALYISFMVAFCATGIGQKVITLDTGQKIAIMEDGSWKYLKEGETGLKADSLTVPDDSESIEIPEKTTETEITTPQLAPDAINENDTASYTNDNVYWSDDFQKRKKDLLSRLISYDSQLTSSIIDIEKSRLESKETEEPKAGQSNSKIAQREELLLKKQAKDRVFHMILDVNGLDENDDVIQELSLIEQNYSEVIDYVDNKKYIADTEPIEKIEANEPEEMDVKESTPEPIDEYAFEIHTTDVTLNPPKQVCQSYVEVDTAQGIDRSKFYTNFEYLFGYTHEKMQPYFKDKEFLTSEGQMASFGVYNFLSLKISIQSKRAQKSYGSIEKGSGLKITFINGEEVYLYNVRASSGQIEEFTGNTIYEISYAVSDKDLKKLSKHEIDQIGIIWSTGFEPYDIYDVDFLMRHANCLVQEEKDYHAQREN